MIASLVVLEIEMYDPTPLPVGVGATHLYELYRNGGRIY